MTDGIVTDPIAVLEAEHRLIERAVAVLEAEAARLDNGDPPRPDVIQNAIEFFVTFADQRHHGKEERYLFPALAAKKPIIRDGPVKVLTGEHESGRYFVRELREGVAGLAASDPGPTARLRRALSLYAMMLRKHIAKEEEIVFLLARVLLTEEEIAAMASDFETADQASVSIDAMQSSLNRLEESASDAAH